MVAEYLVQVSSSWDPPCSWVPGERFASVHPDIFKKYNSLWYNNRDVIKCEEEGGDGTSNSSDVTQLVSRDNCDSSEWNQQNYFLQMLPQLEQSDDRQTISQSSQAVGDGLSQDHFCIGNVNTIESSYNCEKPLLGEIVGEIVGTMNNEKVHSQKHLNTVLSSTSDLPTRVKTITGSSKESEVNVNDIHCYTFEMSPPARISYCSTSYEVNREHWTECVVVVGTPPLGMPFSNEVKQSWNRDGVVASKDLISHRKRHETSHTYETPLAVKTAGSLNKALERIEPSELVDQSKPDIPDKTKTKTKTKAKTKTKNKNKNKNRQKRGFTCQVCGTIFTSQLALVQHLRSHRTSASQPLLQSLKCCGIMFSSRGALLEHSRFHNEHELLRKCEYCKEKFTTNTALVSHTQKQHMNELKMLLLNRQESGSCIGKPVLLPHTTTTTTATTTTTKAVKPILTCPYCTSLFITDAALHNHVRLTHNKIKLLQQNKTW